MKKFLINKLKTGRYKTLITLLDYRAGISSCLKSVKLDDVADEIALVDTLLCSGNNKYRFISFAVNNDGTLKLGSNKYVNAIETLEEANNILKNYPMFVKNSVLPQVEIDKILK